MKRNKIIALAAVVVMVVGAMVLMACGLGCPDSGNCVIYSGNSYRSVSCTNGNDCYVNYIYSSTWYAPATYRCDC